MSTLPDLEAMAIFAKVAQERSFAGAATALGLSKATVSKAVSRLEARFGGSLFNRTSRRLALTEMGQRIADQAGALLEAAEALEAEALEQSATPKGVIRLAVPMSFGLRRVCPLLAAFLAAHPAVSIDLHLSDARVDLIGEGFDLALRIGPLADSSLRARRLGSVGMRLVAAPGYLRAHGHPQHPSDLSRHVCFGYAYQASPSVWRFQRGAENVDVRPSGPLRVNNGDAMMAPLIAGMGMAVLPDFIIDDAIVAGELRTVLDEWSLGEGALHLVTPPGGPRPARIEALIAYFAQTLGRRAGEFG